MSKDSAIIIIAEPDRQYPNSDQSLFKKYKPALVAALLLLLSGALFWSFRVLGSSNPSSKSAVLSNSSNVSVSGKLVSTDSRCGLVGDLAVTCPQYLPHCSQYFWCGSSVEYQVNEQITFSYNSHSSTLPAADANGAAVSDWETCNNPTLDSCSSTGFTCCIAPADVNSKKYTCRPSSFDASQCASLNSLPAAVSDWETCNNPTLDSCSSTGFTCCIAPADVNSKKYTCRPSSYDASQCASLTSITASASSLPAVVTREYTNSYSSSTPASSSSSSSSASMWVTPYQVGNGYTASNWPNPGGCTSTTALIQRAFPTGNIIQWTGEQKNEAIHMIAQQYSYRLIASAAAPETCFKVATLVSSSGVSVQAIVLDYSVVYYPQNVGDVSQAVIDILGGVPSSGHIDIQSISYSNVKTFAKPYGFP